MCLFFERQTHLLVEQKCADFWWNRAFGDTSMKFGMNVLHGVLWKKMHRATWNFKMAAIFQDGRHLSGKGRYVHVKIMIESWNLAWIFSKGHFTRIKSEIIEIPRWPPFFKMAASLVEKVGNLPVNIGIKTWKLVWTFSKGHLTRKWNEPIEISRWRLFSRWPPLQSNKLIMYLLI